MNDAKSTRRSCWERSQGQVNIFYKSWAHQSRSEVRARLSWWTVSIGTFKMGYSLLATEHGSFHTHLAGPSTFSINGIMLVVSKPVWRVSWDTRQSEAWPESDCCRSGCVGHLASKGACSQNQPIDFQETLTLRPEGIPDLVLAIRICSIYHRSDLMLG